MSFDHVVDLVPNGDSSLVECSARIVGFLDEHGDTQFAYEFEGEVPVATTLGIVWMSVSDWIHDRMHGPDWRADG